ncbi:MAG: 1-deoxy-D-xylulose-5-phosphate synthase N-terminal domain-containing protein [Acutalibacteraceae bacterium]
MLLDTIHSRQDLLDIPEDQLGTLCGEIRQFLVQNVSRTGGHLASNLGIVETTVAIHRVFDTSRDRLVFDVGHQCYVHKMLTGRMERFDTLRQRGGLSGFPKPCESVHDAFIAGHASNAVSVALGMARARTMAGEDYHVLALMGDGALTGGLAYEGFNNAGASREPMIVLLNGQRHVHHAECRRNFSLSCAGASASQISRPQIMVQTDNGQKCFRPSALCTDP